MAEAAILQTGQLGLDNNDADMQSLKLKLNDIQLLSLYSIMKRLEEVE